MAGIDDVVKPNILLGLAVVAGAVLLAPVLVPALGRLAKPMGRGAARAGGVFLEKGREAGAELMEVLEDFMAEAKAEMAAVPAASVAPGAVVVASPAPPPSPAAEEVVETKSPGP